MARSAADAGAGAGELTSAIIAAPRSTSAGPVRRHSASQWLVLYDADCGLCMWLLAALLRWDRGARLSPIALQRLEADDLLADLAPAQRLDSWHLISPSGERSSAGAAFPPLLRLLPGGRIPAAATERLPALTERAYRLVADHRAGLSKLVPDARKRRARERVRRSEQTSESPRA